MERHFRLTEWVSQVFHVWQGAGQSYALDSWAEVAVRVVEGVSHEKPVAHPT